MTTDHSLGCLAVEVATENLREQGAIASEGAWVESVWTGADDKLIQETAISYVEYGMAECTCR